MKCPHCLVEFHHDRELKYLGEDSEGTWGIERYNCPNPKCGKDIYFLIKAKFHWSHGEPYIMRTPKAQEIISSKELIRPKGSSRPPTPIEVPRNIANDYEEACLVISDSPKASAALREGHYSIC